MADPDQQPFISKGFDGKIAGSRANQLRRSVEIE